jgi:hypothetical protein
MRAVDLTSATRDLLAPVCRDCVWWQSRRASGSLPADRRDWERAAEAEAGFFGRVLLDEDAVIGYIHTAPEWLIPRARSLPAGPPSPGAYLLMCSYFHDEAYLRGFQFLLQELEASLKHRGVAALEAFGRRRAHPGDPFHGYLREHNLFHPEVLEGGGFRVVKAKGEVARFRLELATIVEAPRHSVLWERRADGGMAAQPI